MHLQLILGSDGMDSKQKNNKISWCFNHDQGALAHRSISMFILNSESRSQCFSELSEIADLQIIQA